MNKESQAVRDASAIVDRFLAAFNAADASGIAALFLPDSVFVGTAMAEPGRGPDSVLAYFTPAMKVNLPKGVGLDTTETLTLSDTAVLFSGRCTFWHTREGRKETAPARYTLLIAKGASGWAIAHFHSSMRPPPPQ